MRNVAAVLLVLLLFSCTKELEINIPTKKPSLMVYSTIVPFSYENTQQLCLKLLSTSHVFDSTINRIDDALVLYYENSFLKDTLSYSSADMAYIISPNIGDFPIANNRYSILVQKPGYESVSATTTIPSQVKITDTLISPIAYFDDSGLIHSEIQLTFDDPLDENNYYEVAVSGPSFSNRNSDDFYNLTTNDNLITSENYYPSLIRFDLKRPKYLLFSDKSINGLKYTLIMYYFPPQRMADKLSISQHYIKIHLRNITEDYYKYKTTMIQHLYSKEEDILYGTGEPINVISNIDRGYGLFAGYNTDIVTIRVDSLIVGK